MPIGETRPSRSGKSERFIDKEYERRETQVAIKRAARVMDTFLDYHRHDGEHLLRSVPGLSIGIVAEGIEPVFVNSGFADKATKTAMTEHSVVRVASLSKNVTATLVRVLQQNSGFDPDIPLRGYYPQFNPSDPRIQNITTADILKHASGAPRDGTSLFGSNEGYNSEQVLLAVANDPSVTGEYTGRLKYSNLGFGLVGKALELFTGRSYRELLQENLFGPIGMTETYADFPDYPIPNLATGYKRASEGGEAIQLWPTDADTPAFGVLSTTADFCKWMQIHFPGNEKILPDSIKKGDQRMHTMDDEGAGYGIGWDIMNHDDDNSYVGHGGNLSGANAFFCNAPRYKNWCCCFSKRSISRCFITCYAGIFFD